MRTALWHPVARFLLAVTALILGFVTAVALPLYGWFMIVWLHIPPIDIFATVGLGMIILGLAAHVIWRGGKRLAAKR